MAHNYLFDLKSELILLCQSTGQFIRQELDKVSPHDIETKALNSFVSYVDKEAEKKIVSKLKALLPDAGFITEENTILQEEKDQVWIIDPLDGTTNFLHKIPHFSISIALKEQDEIVLGIVFEVMHNKSYTAIKGFGAWEDEKPIRIKQTTAMEEAIVVTGFPYDRGLDLDANLSVLKYCILNCRGVRRLGSAALDLAYVASGKIDIYYEKTLNIWDLAAGVLIVNEAGGITSAFQMGTDPLLCGEIIAANPELHPKITKVIRENLC